MSDDSGSREDVVTDTRGRPISKTVANELQTAAVRIRPAVVARRVWERLFSEEERQRLGADFEACWRRFGTAGMWMEARGVSFKQAVIEIAEGANLMDAGTAAGLRLQFDMEDATPVHAENQPSWNPDRGELKLGDCVIRSVRVLQIPSNIQQILDAFQTQGWPSRIDNPSGLSEQLHQTLRSLNRGLKRIRFHSQEGAQSIVWKRV